MNQVDKTAYQFFSYAHPGRFVSYYHQLAEALSLAPKSILEVGVGNGVFRDYIKGNTTTSYTSVDVADDLHPDVVSGVTSLPFADDSFDAVCAFEILEHIPFDQFEKALAEIHRVARHAVVLSLPHFGPPVKFLLKVPFLPEISFAFKIPFARKHVFNGHHYWEIGKNGYSPRIVRAILQKYFFIKKEFVPFENQYHHFYILKKVDHLS